MLTPADERAHLPDDDPAWEESWSFDFVAAGAGVAGYARLALRDRGRRAWWWCAVVGRGLPVVLVRDHDLDPPRPGTFEVRGTGLWADPVCETAFDHWSLGLEAFAVGVDDPVEAYGRERGDRVPLGFDLEWEADGQAGALAPGAGQGYAQGCTVHGDVLVGPQRLVVSGMGTRDHRWGPRDWWSAPAGWVSGRFDDGQLVAGPATVAVDDRGLLTGGSVAGTTFEPVFHAPVQIPADDGRVSRLARALCRLSSADGGPGGWAWVDALQPASSSSG